ncbi:hypothetical protein [Novosphingobium jiangmenense]|uniref:Uncharacterized protein n=1 Tax=Novosphingobium jiangmenense TaxID=2791981 RepID=A0ABS0HD29_9SPHN|nr:hypothetical protein [Novosphingobium jiangmenense]MBF9149871.1 hypothetical protein [Novosphingobium jiangmenense]
MASLYDRHHGKRPDTSAPAPARHNRAVMAAFKLAVAINVAACLLLLPDIVRSGDAGVSDQPSGHFSGF